MAYFGYQEEEIWSYEAIPDLVMLCGRRVPNADGFSRLLSWHYKKPKENIKWFEFFSGQLVTASALHLSDKELHQPFWKALRDRVFMV